MTMKLTYGEMVGASAAFGELLQITVPMKTALKLRRMAMAMNDELRIFNAHMQEIRNKYKEEDSNKIKSEHVAAFQQEAEDLGAVEVEIQVSPIPSKELGPVAVKGGTILALAKFIED